MKAEAVIASDLCKTYEIGDLRIEVLKNVTLKVEKSEFPAISFLEMI